MSNVYKDMGDDELEEIAKRALAYRNHIEKQWPTTAAILNGMMAYWTAVNGFIGKRYGERACGMYYRMYGAQLMEATGGCDKFSYALASSEEATK